jgi:hypothetical protein
MDRAEGRRISGQLADLTADAPSHRRTLAEDVPSPIMVKMNQTAPVDPVHCAGCELEVDWPPIKRDGRNYCCDGCAAGGPCCCSYDESPVQLPQRQVSSE